MNYILVSDQEIDAATPEMLKDAARIVILTALKGYKKLVEVFKKSMTTISSKPLGYSELMGQFEKDIFYNS
jgi:hypothetical protein